MTITLADLPYDHDALQSVISAATLKLHHGVHHRGYVDKLNALVKGTDLADASLDAVIERGARSVAAAAGVFGSGWAWLVRDGEKLAIQTTSNADTPIVRGQIPLLVVDVWEHAYYLDHQAKRAAYVDGVVDHLLDWDFAEINYRGGAPS